MALSDQLVRDPTPAQRQALNVRDLCLSKFSVLHTYLQNVAENRRQRAQWRQAARDVERGQEIFDAGELVGEQAGGNDAVGQPVPRVTADDIGVLAHLVAVDEADAIDSVLDLPAPLIVGGRRLWEAARIQASN